MKHLVILMIVSLGLSANNFNKALDGFYALAKKSEASSYLDKLCEESTWVCKD